MKKFNKSDLFYNVIKTYPKIEFYYNNGKLFFDRNNYPDVSSDIPFGSIGLFELINKVHTRAIAVADGVLLLENSNFLMLENDNNLATE